MEELGDAVFRPLDDPPAPDPTPSQPPLQFRLRSLIWITVVCALIFGVMRWLGVSSQAATLVLVILIVDVLAAVGLVMVIASSSKTDRE
jgi:hypothetical protein